MVLTKAWDGKALLAALKVSTLADAPKVVGDFMGVLLGWISASAVAGIAASPYLGLLSGLVPVLLQSIQGSLGSLLPGLSIQLVPVAVAKAWDGKSLVDAMKAKGIPDVELLLADDVQVIFDWIAASLAMGPAIEQAIAPLISSVANFVKGELAKLEAKI